MGFNNCLCDPILWIFYHFNPGDPLLGREPMVILSFGWSFILEMWSDQAICTLHVGLLNITMGKT